MTESRAPGLRLQIVLALGALMVLAFVPLFFAVANLTRATLRGVREESARALGRAVAAHVGDARRVADRASLPRHLESDVGQGGVEAIVVYGPSGTMEASAGDDVEIRAMHAPRLPYGEGASTVRGARGRALDVVVPVDDAAVVARLRTDDRIDQATPLVGLFAIYMSTFALALLVFAYFALTRLIVRPIDALVRSADRVALARSPLMVPEASARELVELGASLEAMTQRLMADESAMRSKVEELTQTTKRLSETRIELARSERLASVGRLAAGIAHEIGNPIAAIMGMEDLLLAGGLPRDVESDFLVRMKRETERIHGILRDLLDFARPEAASSQSTDAAVTEPVADLAVVIDDVLSLVKTQATFKSIHLRTDVEAGAPSVALSAQRLTQVLLNLVLNAGNALEAVPVSGLRVITLRARREGKSLRLEVEDTGPGVDAKVRSQLFEPFVTTREVGKGTGLGLAVCRGIVEAANGTIALDLSYEGGARFVISLPWA